MATADGAWNENAAVFEQNYLLDTVSALDTDNAVLDDEVMKEAETAVVESEAVDFPDEGVLVPAMGAPQTGWHVGRFPQGPGRMRLVSTPLWSLRPPTCEPEVWSTIGKAAQREMRAKWQADDRDAFAAQEERRSSWRRAKRGGGRLRSPVSLGRWGGELPGAGSASDGHACLPCAPTALHRL